MKTTQTIETNPLYKNVSDLIARLPSALRTRRAVMIGGFLLLGLGMTLNWSWLSAIGAAPIILSLAPCAAMCAMSICCMKGNKDQDSTNLKESDDTNVS